MKLSHCLACVVGSRRAVRFGRIGWVLAAALLLGPAAPAARAGPLEEFEEASKREKGVELIPTYFSSLRKDATTIADEVVRRKEEVAKFDQKTIERAKNAGLKELAHLKSQIKYLERDMEQFKELHKGGEVDLSFFVNKIKELNEKVEKLNGALGDVNILCARAADGYERLSKARGGLREYFDRAKDELKKARSDPESVLGKEATDEQKKTLIGYIDRIISRIEAGEADHKAEEDGHKVTHDTYIKLINKSTL